MPTTLPSSRSRITSTSAPPLIRQWCKRTAPVAPRRLFGQLVDDERLDQRSRGRARSARPAIRVRRLAGRREAGVRQMQLGVLGRLSCEVARPCREPVHQEDRFEQFDIAVHGGPVQPGSARGVGAVVLLRSDRRQVRERVVIALARWTRAISRMSRSVMAWTCCGTTRGAAGTRASGLVREAAAADPPEVVGTIRRVRGCACQVSGSSNALSMKNRRAVELTLGKRPDVHHRTSAGERLRRLGVARNGSSRRGRSDRCVASRCG